MTTNSAQEQVRTVTFVTWGGLIANLVLAAIKVTAGILGNSRAVVADGIHSLSDLVTDIAVLVGVRMWNAPPDEDHPYGHQRIETLVTVGIGILLTCAGVGIGWDAIMAFGSGTVHSAKGVALLAAIISIVAKELLYRWTVREAKRVNSSALAANAWHHRSDALSSLPAALAVAISMILPGWAFVDLIGAIIVAIFIIHAAWGICRPALDALIDRGAPQEVIDILNDLACSVRGVESVHRLRTRYQGPRLFVDLHIGVDENLTVRQGHDIADEVENLLKNKGPEVADVLVHVDPLKPEDTTCKAS